MFITFEGLDGCGKSTHLDRLTSKLTDRSLDIVATREPGGTAAGEQIRQLLLDIRTSGLHPRTELALMFASRVQHIEEVILPALKAGKIVVCDRFTDSSEAYQGSGRGLGSQIVLDLHRVLCGDLTPDLTILLDSDVKTSVGRARRRNQMRSNSNTSEESRFESENRAFFERVRKAYMEIARRETQRVVIVDARGTPDQTHEKIMRIVDAKLKMRDLSRRSQDVG